MKMVVFWDVALMMEAVSIFETSGNFYQTTRLNIPEYIFKITFSLLTSICAVLQKRCAL
jgi:hypothetical protein